MGVSTVRILAARDRMKEVLSPVLGAELALERANNIAQVLAYSTRAPATIAAAMLRETGIRDVQRVARELERAWETGLSESEAGHAPAA